MINYKQEKIDFLIIGVSFVLLIMQTFTFLQNHYSFVFSCLLYIFIIFLMLLKKNSFIQRNSLVALMTTVLVSIAMMLISSARGVSLIGYWGEYLPYIIWASLCFFVAPLMDDKTKNIFITLFLCFFAISVVATLTVVIEDNEASRLLAGAATAEERFYYYSKGVGGYGFIYGCVFLLYAIILWRKNIKNKLGKFLLLVLSITMFAMILFASYTTALLFALLIILLASYIGSKKKRSLSMLLVVFTLIFIFRVPILEGIKNIATQFNLYWIENRLGQLIQSFTSGDITDLRRYELYKTSWDTFLNSPLIGGNSLGGHSMLFDHMGEFGIAGLLFFICQIYIIRVFSKQITKQKSIIFILVILFMCIDTVDTIVLIPLVYFVLPIMLKK